MNKSENINKFKYNNSYINHISYINYNNTYHSHKNNSNIVLFYYLGIIFLLFCCILSCKSFYKYVNCSTIPINNVIENINHIDNDNIIQPVNENLEKNSTNIVIYDSDDSENLPTYTETIKDDY